MIFVALALVVRAVLVPALLALLGGFSAWPRKLRGADVVEEPSASPAGG